MSFYPASWSPADESTYARQGSRVSRLGLRGLRQLAELHLRDRARQETPSPLRWGWLALVGLAMRVGPNDQRTVAVLSTLGHLGCAVLAGVIWGPAAGVLVLASPLGLTLGRRALGDTWAALAALALLAAATQGAHHVAIWALVVAAMAVKESSVAAVLAVAVLGPWQACVEGLAAWWTMTVTLFGWRGTLGLLGIARAQPRTTYSRAEQSGMPHRTFVDLALVSPVPMLAGWALLDRWWWGEGAQPVALFGWIMIGLSLCSPLRNVRLLLAADLALRIAVASSDLARVGPLGIVALVTLDLLIAWRIRDVYDPTTRALVGAVCR